jgi:hypothetical protein
MFCHCCQFSLVSGQRGINMFTVHVISPASRWQCFSTKHTSNVRLSLCHSSGIALVFDERGNSSYAYLALFVWSPIVDDKVSTNRIDSYLLPFLNEVRISLSLSCLCDLLSSRWQVSIKNILQRTFCHPHEGGPLCFRISIIEKKIKSLQNNFVNLK